VTGVAAHDQSLDSPTNNFCAINPKYTGESLTAGVFGTVTEGNLKHSYTNAQDASLPCTHKTPASGKWYFEWAVIAGGGNSGYSPSMGIIDPTVYTMADPGTNTPGLIAYTNYENKVRKNGTYVTTYGGSRASNGDVMGIAVDMDNGAFYVSKNGTYFADGNSATGDPTSGSSKTGAGATWTPASEYTSGMVPISQVNGGNAGEININFGQDGTFQGTETAGGNSDANGLGNFFTAPPTDYLAICSSNLTVAEEVDPAETNDDFPQKLFNTVLHTGSGAEKAIAVGFQPDWSWIKERGAAGDHKLTDSSRGVTKSLEINTTTAEATEAQGVKAFTSTGITLGTDVAYNNNTDTYVSWNWRVNGGTTATNENGSIDTTVQVNAAAGISIVTWTGSGSAATLGHGLGATPAFVVGKSRTASADLMDWPAMHKNMNGGALGVDNSRIYFNSPDAYSTGTLWVPSQNSSTVFGSSGANTNDGSKNHVAYCFAEVEGFSKFGYYEGNGNADGAFVYTGFSPALVICKSVDSGSDWQMFDNKRLGANSTNNELQTNESDAEVATLMIDLLSNGFKCRIATDPNVAETYVYLAWASNPFKYATAR
jgi:hypothetical protein